MDELEVHIIYLIDSRAHNNLFSVISFDPQKYKGYMIEKVNIGQVMNQYQIVTDTNYVYVELADGSQGKIKKSDLVEVIRTAMPVATQDSKGLMSNNGFFQGNTIENITDYNNSIGAGTYSHTVDIGNGNPTGILFVIHGKRYSSHVDIPTGNGKLAIKTIRPTGELLRDWRTIDFTKD